MADLALTSIMAVWGSSFAVLRGLMGDSAASPLALVAVRMAMATVLLTAFLAVTPNSEMMGVFWMAEPRTLYGRRTEIIHEGSKIGDIVEVLPLV